MKAVGFGSVVADILMSRGPIAINHKNLVDFQIIQVGGVIPTALMTLSRLGIETCLKSVLGNDEFGNTLMDIFKREKVRTEDVVKLDNSHTPLAFVVLNSLNGQRTNFYTTGEFSHKEINTLNLDLDKDTSLLLIDGHNIKASQKIINSAKTIGAKVMLDLGSPKKDLESLIPYADIITVPGAYWKEVWPGERPENIINRFLEKYDKDFFLTMEEKGSLVGSNKKVFHQPAFNIEVKDTNGAGDIFFGSLAFGYLKNWDLIKTVRFATAAAAFACSKIGKDKKIPTFSDIEKILHH